jgi:pimeloyl-ACP methyl ester carboxylesterase
VSDVQTVSVPHLGGSTIGYKMAREYDPSCPTLVLANSFSTSAQLYRPQFSDSDLSEAVNLLAIEPFGHGATRATYRQFTYWDSAVANLQVLDALGISEAFALGTSQGGWIVTMMAIHDPRLIKGIIPLGTSMDSESQRTRDLGCWDGITFCTPAIDSLATRVDENWVIPDELIDAVLLEGFSDTISEEERAFWHENYKKNYVGDEGRHLLRVCSICLRDRDSLHARLDGVHCPVLWMQGTSDRVYSVANAQEEIELFANSPNAELRIVDDGQHFLSASHPQEVNPAALEFVQHLA